MSNTERVFEMAILGRATWELHSLNNEGTVGNVTEPRSLKIIDPNTGNIVTTDGISGEMLKHMHVEMMWRLEEDKSNNLCEACRSLQPSRFDYVVQKTFEEYLREKGKKSFSQNKRDKEKEKEEALNMIGISYSVESVIGEAIERCEICDTHGFLIQDPTGSRSSLVEFGWAVALPNMFERDIHTHTRHAPGEKKKKDADVEQQMVYHRPTRTGVYTIVTMFQPWKIGMNNVTRRYIDSVDREKRYKIVLEAYRSMFLQPEGAMSTTRFPHVVNFEGIIVYTTRNIPVPKISPLNDNYKEEIKEIANKIDGNAVKYLEFQDLKEFAERINDLLNKKPY